MPRASRPSGELAVDPAVVYGGRNESGPPERANARDGPDHKERALPMADAHATAGNPVTVVVPPTGAKRLRVEALHNVATAAKNVAEGAHWQLAQRDSARLDQADLPRMRDADRAWTRIRPADPDGSVSVVAGEETVADLLRSCIRSVADEIRDTCDGDWSPRDVRALALELGAWADVFDDHGIPGLPTSMRRDRRGQPPARRETTSRHTGG